MNVFDIETVILREDALEIIDQTLLPGAVKYLRLTEQADIWEAVNKLRVRGAPAIGVAAAAGMYLAAREIRADAFEDFMAEFMQKKAYLASARPTAVNLFWALDRMEACARAQSGKPLPEVLAALKAEAVEIREEDIRFCLSIGRHGSALLRDGMGVLTHCNTGTLATSKYGTALAAIYMAKQNGVKDLRAYCTETRPLLQGARLTAFELMAAGVDTTLLCDNMVASLMRAGRVDVVILGGDRVAANGDVVNKIGTANIAAIARRFGIPFYSAVPTSTIDMSLKTGDEIEIEQRDPGEVTDLWYAKRMAPAGVKVYNPAFDLTDNAYVSGIITEYGIARPPFDVSLGEIMQKAAKKEPF